MTPCKILLFEFNSFDMGVLWSMRPMVMLVSISVSIINRTDPTMYEGQAKFSYPWCCVERASCARELRYYFAQEILGFFPSQIPLQIRRLAPCLGFNFT